MWLTTNFGFFSIVVKPHDRDAQSLTIRSRVRKDLETLKERYLPQMGLIEKGGGTDYEYRAPVARVEFANALLQIGLDIDYNNFKNSVAKNQCKKRAGLYEKVWEVLCKLKQIALSQMTPLP